MSKIALKFFDDLSPEVLMLHSEWWNTPHNGVELASYHLNGFDSNFIEKIRQCTLERYRILHSCHPVTLDTYFNDDVKVYKDMDNITSTQAGIYKRVIHVNRCSKVILSPQEAYEEYLPVFQDAVNNNTYLLVENVNEDIAWMEAFFNHFPKSFYQKMGFTFDIGHAKALSRIKHSLEEWSQWIDTIQDRFLLHYHIHGNDGSYDAHIPLYKAADQGLTLPAVNLDVDVLEWFERERARRLPLDNVIFTLETPLVETSLMLAGFTTPPFALFD